MLHVVVIWSWVARKNCCSIFINSFSLWFYSC